MYVLVSLLIFIVISFILNFLSVYHGTDFYIKFPFLKKVYTKLCKYNSIIEAIFFIGFIFSFIFVALLILIPILRYESRLFIAEYQAVHTTIERMRDNEDIMELEKTAVYISINEINRELGRIQYQNETQWGIFVDNEIMELEFIE